MKNYSYPRVITSVTALNRSSTRPEAEDTTVLFVPIISTTGPEKAITRIHSLEEFRSTFGTDTRMGLTLLNISNWLTSGGTLYTYRIIPTSGARKSGAALIQDNALQVPVVKVEALSKYVGSMLNGYKLVLDLATSSLVTVRLVDPDTNITVEKFSVSVDTKDMATNVTLGGIKEFTIDVTKKSEYLSSLKFRLQYQQPTVAGTPGKIYFDNDASSTTITLVFGEENEKAITDGATDKYKYVGTDGWEDSTTTINSITTTTSAYEQALRYFWNVTNDSSNEEVKFALGNRADTPIDLIMDANYHVDIKKAMIKVISHENEFGEDDALRSDIRGYFDINDVLEGVSVDEDTIAEALGFSSASATTNINRAYRNSGNIFLYTQKFVISEETYFNNSDMEVYPSYYLSMLIPANDLSNGIQAALAGKRRAVLDGIKKLSKNPDPDEKEELFVARVNYVEKDSRGYYFMSQRTFDGSTDDSYNALSFINNSRVTCRMVHDLEKLGSSYLFEVNDATTIANMEAAMNKYVTNWISNRTLTAGSSVTVTADEYSTERVNAVLHIRFRGTIETISIDLILH